MDWRDIMLWRQDVAALYRPVSEAVALGSVWTAFVTARRQLIHTHPGAMSVLDKTAPHYFDYNPDFATESHFAPLDAGQQHVVSGGSDGEITFTAIARSTELTPLLGAELTLYWLDQYGGGLFLPFKDASCGSASYGGGRYLIDSVKSAFLGVTSAGRLRLDFNYAYFPSCAHDDRYVCPLSPQENTLPVAITAGECWQANH